MSEVPVPPVQSGAAVPETPGLTGGRALEGMRVIDLSRVLAGPYCTQILGDHGADVIKVEPPAGDETRNWGPPFVGDTAAYYMGVNRNKRGIVLDLSLPAQRDCLLELLAGADVIIENFRSGTMERWGLGQEVLAARFPQLIYCKITGFGDDGPLGGLPGYDAAIQAMAGLMSVNGEKGGAPLRVGVPIVDLVTGYNAALGILLALAERNRSGKGQLVETALYDCALTILHPHAANYLNSGDRPGRSGNAHPNITPYDSFDTRTVPVFLAIGTDRQFVAFCREMDRVELATDSRFTTNRDRNSHRHELKTLLKQMFANHDGAELADRLMRQGVPCAPVLEVPEVLAHPHVAHRAMLVENGDYRGIASAVKLGRTPAAYRAPPPDRGEHDDEILGRGTAV